MMQVDYEMLGARIKEYRQRRELSQAMLAEMVHISVPYLSHIENGSKKISLDVFVLIAKALQVPMDELMEERMETMVSNPVYRMGGVFIKCRSSEREIIEATVTALIGALRNNSR